MGNKLKLVDSVDAYNFHAGMPLVVSDDGRLVPMTRRQRLLSWMRNRWLRATRWFRPRTVVDAVDSRAGSITLVEQRWSWRRWRWETVDGGTVPP